MTTSTAPAVQIETCGEVTPEEQAYLRLRIDDALRFASQPVLYTRARLTLQHSAKNASRGALPVRLSKRGRS